MGDLLNWAEKWGVSAEALADLSKAVQPIPLPMPPGEESEAAVMARVRLEASEKGLLLWRNNVGVAQDTHGNVVRFGLANESKIVNKQFKSSDLIGIRPVIITQEHVGKTVGQFTAREIKSVKWKYSNSNREKAQKNFLEIIQSMGGDAQFANGIGTL